MNPNRPLSVATACLVLAGLSAGQISLVTDYDPAFDLAWPFAGGQFERVVLGRFLDDGGTHALILRSGELYFAFDPCAYEAVLAPAQGAPADVLDASVIPAGSLADRLYFTDTAGLWSTWVDPETLVLTAPVLVQPGWAGAGLLHTVDLDGQGGLDLVGAMGTTAVVRVDSGSGSPTWLTLGFSAPLIDFTAGDFDGDGTPELAGSTASGLEFRTLAGTLLKSWTIPGTNGPLTSVRRNGLGSHVAVFAADSLANGQWKLFAADVDARTFVADLLTHIPGNQQPTTLWVEPTSLATQDVDADGYVDVVVSHASFATAFALVNSNTAPGGAFRTAGDQVIWSLVPDPLTVPSGVTADHNLASFGMTLPTRGSAHPVDATDTLYLISSQAPSELLEATGPPLVASIAYEFDHLGPGFVDVDQPELPKCRLHFTLNAPAEVLTAGYRTLAVLVWKSDPTNTRLESTPVFERQLIYDLTDWQDEAEFAIDLFLDLDDETAWHSDHPHYFVDFRFVSLVQSPVPAGGLPATIAQIATRSLGGLTIDPVWDPDPPQSDPPLEAIWLDELPASSPPFSVGIDDAPNTFGRVIGAYLGLGRLPAFPTEQPPGIPPPQVSKQTVLFL